MLSKLKRTTAILAAFAIVFSCVWCAVVVQVTASADASYKAVLADLDGCIPDANEEALVEYMQWAADNIECNIGVVITSDLNGKTDTQYSEGFLNDIFGRGSSSVVLMLLNTYDNPKYANYYDKLSLDGRGYDYYDSKANKIFDRVYDGLDSSGFEEAVREFCDALVKYKGSGGGASYGGSSKYEFKDMLTVTFGAMIFGLVLSLIVTNSVASKYSKKAPVSAANYLDRNRIVNTKKTDVFVREYTRTYTNSSSGGSSGGGGHSSHSGSHRSGGHSSHSGRHR